MNKTVHGRFAIPAREKADTDEGLAFHHRMNFAAASSSINVGYTTQNRGSPLRPHIFSVNHTVINDTPFNDKHASHRGLISNIAF